jgi:ATP synthase protein I
MPTSDDPRDEALRQLRERADALQATAVRPAPSPAGHAAVGKAYQILGYLVSGPVVGLAVGFAVDWAAGTMPWGLIVGVLLGFAAAVYLAKKAADRIMAQAKAEEAANPSPPAAAYDDDEEN